MIDDKIHIPDFEYTLPQKSSDIADLAAGFREARILRDVVCYNQSATIQYHYVAADYHRDLRRQWSEVKQLHPFLASSPKEIKKSLTHAVSKIDHFLNKEFDFIVGGNFSYMKHFFKSIGKKNTLRLGVMLPADSSGGATTLIDLYRDPQIPQGAFYRRVTDYSAFSRVNSEGTYFLCNNIPREALSGTYENHRLVGLRKYREYVSAIDPSAIDKPSEDDIEWCRAWAHFSESDALTERGVIRSCYKSNLIIPITLRNNYLHQDFKNKFPIKKLDKTTFGYLCMDSTEVDYFSNPASVDLGYIVADLLCTLLLARYVFTKHSDPYMDIVDSLRPHISD